MEKMKYTPYHLDIERALSDEKIGMSELEDLLKAESKNSDHPFRVSNQKSIFRFTKKNSRRRIYPNNDELKALLTAILPMRNYEAYFIHLKMVFEENHKKVDLGALSDDQLDAVVKEYLKNGRHEQICEYYYCTRYSEEYLKRLAKDLFETRLIYLSIFGNRVQQYLTRVIEEKKVIDEDPNYFQAYMQLIKYEDIVASEETHLIDLGIREAYYQGLWNAKIGRRYNRIYDLTLEKVLLEKTIQLLKLDKNLTVIGAKELAAESQPIKELRRERKIISAEWVTF